MTSNYCDTGFGVYWGGSTRVDQRAVSDSLQGSDCFTFDVCRCRICTAAAAENSDSFVVDVCRCQICRANADNGPSQSPTLLSNVA